MSVTRMCTLVHASLWIQGGTLNVMGLYFTWNLTLMKGYFSRITYSDCETLLVHMMKGVFSETISYSSFFTSDFGYEYLFHNYINTK